MAAPEAIRISDDSTRLEVIEALVNIGHRASRETPVVGSTEHPTPWDRRHAALDDLLAQLERIPA